jgi:hypothetical protein
MATNPFAPSSTLQPRFNVPQKYTYKPNGRGGINYFRDSVPVTNTEYRQATGQNTDQIEASAGRSLQDVGVPAPVETDTLNNAANSGTQDTSGTTSSAQAAFTAPRVAQIPGNPRIFNMLDATDRADYYNLAIPAAQAEADKQRSRYATDTSNAYKTAERGFGDQSATLADSVEREKQAEADYGRGYDTRVTNFGKDYRGGIAQRQNAFASANGFQSAQGDSEGLATDAYNKGLADLGAEKASNQNSFALTRGALDRNRTNLAANYGDYITGLQKSANEKNTALDNYVAEQKQNLTSQIAPLNEYQGVNNFDYKLDTYDPTKVNTTDLSKYGVATSFNATPAAKTLGAPSPTGGNAFALPAQKTDPTAQYLDYQKTLKTPDTLNSYLYNK